MNYLLDACALLAVFNDEHGGQTMLDMIEEAQAGQINLFMSIVQLLEVYYDRLSVSGEHEARIRVEAILAEPITIIDTISYSAMYEAGKFKTSFSISLADAIAAGIAKNLGAVLITKDGEFEAPEKAGELSVLWLE
jgi:predicted nucleic acid-binding protein